MFHICLFASVCCFDGLDLDVYYVSGENADMRMDDVTLNLGDEVGLLWSIDIQPGHFEGQMRQRKNIYHLWRKFVMVEFV